MSFSAQPNYFAGQVQPLNYGNMLAQAEQLKASQASRQMADQKMQMNEIGLAFREAISRGDLETAKRLDPQAAMEYETKALALSSAKFQQQAQRAQGIGNIIDQHFTQDVLDNDQKLMQMAPMFVRSMEANGNPIDPSFLQQTPDEIREAVQQMHGFIAPYLEPPKWTGGQSAIGPDGQPTFMQTDQRGNVRPVPGGFMPPPRDTWEVTTNPDGSTSVSFGQPGTGGDLEKTVRKDLQTAINDTSNSLDNLRRTGEQFDREYLTYQGKARALWFRGKDKLDVLSGDDALWYSDYVGFMANASDFMNAEIKRLTGAAMSEPEAVRLRKGMPDPENDSPEEFARKWSEKVHKIEMIRARAHYYLANGMEPPKNPNATWAVQIEDMEGIIEARATELTRVFMADLGNEKLARDKALRQTKEEFGL